MAATAVSFGAVSHYGLKSNTSKLSYSSSQGVRPVTTVVGAAPSRVYCSLPAPIVVVEKEERKSNLVESLVKKAADAGKVATVALVASALAVSGNANAEGTPSRMTYDEIQEQTYLEVKGSGSANRCPIMKGGSGPVAFMIAGDYTLKNLCFEPTSFTVKTEGPFKGSGEEFQKTKLMTRLTYTLDNIDGSFMVAKDGTVKFVENGGIDYAAVTVQLAGGERVPFLFTIKELVAEGKPDAISGTFVVPSYRGSSFLDPKGRGGSTGYENAVALPAGGRGDEDELAKENLKDTGSLKGKITFRIEQSDIGTGEVAGVFQSIQPSDTDLGSKAPKDVKIEGVWYGQLEGFDLNWWKEEVQRPQEEVKRPQGGGCCKGITNGGAESFTRGAGPKMRF